MPAPVQRAHLVQMSFIISLFNKLLQDQLIHFGYRRADESAPLMVHFTYFFREDHIAHPYGRRDGLGKCTDVDHFPVCVIALEGRDGLPFIPEFTVIVIFNDIPVFRF